MAERDIAYRIRLLFSKGGSDEASEALDNIKTKLLNLDPNTGQGNAPFGKLKAMKSDADQAAKSLDSLKTKLLNLDDVGGPTDTFHSVGQAKDPRGAMAQSAKVQAFAASTDAAIGKMNETIKKTTLNATILGDATGESLEEIEDAANKADVALRELVSEFVSNINSGADFDDTLRQIQTRLGNLQAQSGDDLKKLAADLGLSADQAQRLATAVAAAQASSKYRSNFQQTRSLTGATESLSGLGSAASTLGFGEVGGGLLIAGAITQTAQEIPKLRVALTGIPSTIKAVAQAIGGPTLGLIGGLGALAVVLTLAQQAAAARAASARAILDEQEEYFTLIQTGTAESIAELQEKNRLEQEAAQANLDLLNEQKRQVDEALAQFNEERMIPAALLDLAINMGITGGEVKALNEEIAEAETTLAGLTKQEDLYTDALNSGEVARNTAIANERKLAQARIEVANQYLATAQQIYGLRGQDAESLRDQRDALEEHNRQLQNAITGLGDPGDNEDLANQVAAYNLQIEQNQDVINAITRVYLRQAEAAELLEKQIEGSVGLLNAQADSQRVLNALLRSGTAEDAGRRALEIQDELDVLIAQQGELLMLPELTGAALDQYTQNLAAITALTDEQGHIADQAPLLIRRAKDALEEEIRAIGRALEEAIAKAKEKMREADAESERDAEKAREDAAEDREKSIRDAEAKAAKDREEGLKKHHDRLKKIDEDASDDLRKAIRARDAGAAEKVLEDARKKRKEEEKSYQDSQAKIEDTLRDQLAKIDEKYNEQLETIQERLEEQLEAHKVAYERQVAEARANAKKETDVKNAEYRKQLTDLNTFLAAQRLANLTNNQRNLTELNNFNVRGQKEIKDFVDGAIKSLKNLNSKIGIGGNKPRLTPESTGTGYKPPVTVQSSVTVNARTGANAQEIADKASRSAVKTVKRAVERSYHGGV